VEKQNAATSQMQHLREHRYVEDEANRQTRQD
jgi:hypothetical protein